MSTSSGTAPARPGKGESQAQEGPASWVREQRAALKELLDKPLTTYYLIIMCSALLLALGLMMVLSASAVEAQQKTGSPFSWFIKQSLSAAVGLPVMYACSRLPLKFFRWAGYPLMALSVLALVMVLFIGESELGAQRWIYVGPFTLQPSEPAKLALVLWGADLLARRARQGRIEWRQLLIPLMPGTAILAVMVMLGRDLGTTLVLFMIFLALLWVVGAPVKLFGGILALAVL
ncbi:MAG: FtsW/RodA/SpoVE family cell cycle protein, partial [Nonomuraea sp.]|nr:FtsW/RodA/SpoVE family cell cycle protein [Nonomuraea sp.]